MNARPRVVMAGLMSATAPLVAAATLAGAALAGPAASTSSHRAFVPANTTCVRVHALDQLKYPECLGD
jgi:hypothetical protein